MPLDSRKILALGVWMTVAVAGCRIEQGSAPAPRANRTLEPAPATAPASARAAAPASAPRGEAGEKKVHLPAEVAWQTWEQGLERARTERKPVMLVVYADWCPHCRDMGPVLARPDVVELSKRMVMISQDADERPTWLAERFDAPYGSYVPRVFFLTSEGAVREDLQSGNPKYPYFFAPQAPDQLVGAMRRALGS
jgi:thiol:disulfide interchange protein